jgi:hypothetical protein
MFVNTKCENTEGKLYGKIFDLHFVNMGKQKGRECEGRAKRQAVYHTKHGNLTTPYTNTICFEAHLTLELQ